MATVENPTTVEAPPVQTAPPPDVPAPVPAKSLQPGPRTRLFTADEFERMADAGVLTDQERVELIEGKIIVMSRIKGPHAACVDRLTDRFATRVRGRAIV